MTYGRSGGIKIRRQADGPTIVDAHLALPRDGPTLPAESRARGVMDRQRRSLFEHLSVRVPRTGAEGTRVSETDTETYDDDPGLGGLGVPVGSAVTDGSTRRTAIDGETYDDDAGAGLLGVPLVMDGEGTRATFVDRETYDDDPGVEALGIPAAVSDATYFTKQDLETYDDDPGLSPLAVPRLDEGTLHTRSDNETFDDDPGTAGLAFPSIE
jgi:hypothetical protein